MSGLITAAAIGAYSKQKARVLVVDRNPPSSPGKKTINGWTCGDAVSKRSIDYISANIGINYGSPELEHKVEGSSSTRPIMKLRCSSKARATY